MKAKNYVLIALINLTSMFLLFCTRTTYERSSNGSWVENKNKTQFFPSYAVKRSKKQIYLSYEVERSIKEYYRINGYWPFSTSAYQVANDENKYHLQNLYEQGFEMLDFVTTGNDTLNLKFHFRTKGEILFGREGGLPVGKTIVGKFIFIAYPTGEISMEKKIEGSYREKK